MKILILNGNGFIGTHLAECLLASGNQVSVFHRSSAPTKGQADGLHHIIGDRDTDLSVLDGQNWDCTVDLGALEPSRVARLADRGVMQWGHYILVSSTEVYEPPTLSGFNESSPLRQSDKADGNLMGDYGYRKVLCELASDAFPMTTIIRPTYVIGRNDPTSRFNRWVARICNGGEVVIPDPSDLPFQAVDVRDVASFLNSLIVDSKLGTFQLTAPFPPITFTEVLRTIQDFSPQECHFVNIPIAELVRSGKGPTDFPLWPGWNESSSEESGDPSLAMLNGFSPRPIDESIAWIVEGFLEKSTIV